MSTHLIVPDKADTARVLEWKTILILGKQNRRCTERRHQEANCQSPDSCKWIGFHLGPTLRRRSTESASYFAVPDCTVVW
jgi:hypothetical protein